MIWRMDKYEREPLTFVLLHFLWGAFGAIALGIIGSIVLSNFTGLSNDKATASLIQTIIVAPFSEEIAKGILLLWTVTSRKFDNITDGLIYGGAIGLGFGMTENFSYFISYGDTFEAWVSLVIIRSGFSAVMHAISTATFGVFLGIAKFSLKSYRFYYPIIGLILAMFFHFIWNYTVSFNSTFFLGFFFILILLIYFFMLFKYAIRKEKRIIESELTEESENNLLPKEHIQIISSHLRFRKGWVDDSIRKKYFRTAIRLAFNKMHSKKSQGVQKQLYEIEVENNRDLIRSLLSQEA